MTTIRRVLDREEDARHATATQFTLDRHPVAQQALEAKGEVVCVPLVVWHGTKVRRTR